MASGPEDYEYIDGVAWPLLTDSPIALLQSRDNLAAVAKWRAPQAAMGFTVPREPSFADVGGRRICGAWPVAYGPFWLYLRESVAAIEVLVRLAVTWSLGVTKSDGVDALLMHATTITPGVYDPPPAYFEDWALDLDTAAAVSTKALAANARGRSGWVGVLLWVKSYLELTPEVTGIIDNVTGWGSLAINWTSGTAPNPIALGSNALERAVLPTPRVTDNQVSGEALTYQVCHYLDPGGAIDAVTYLAPPFYAVTEDAVWAAADTVAMHTMGVGALSGVQVQAQTSLAAPARESFFNREPCKWQSASTLVAETERLATDRVPHYSTQSVDLDAVNKRQWWSLASIGAGFVALKSWYIKHTVPASDRNGYRVLLGLYAAASGPYALGRELRLELRLAAYTPLAGAQQAGTPLTVDMVVHDQWGLGPRYEPLAHNHWGARELGDWQFRGAFLTDRAPHVGFLGDDFRRIQWVELIIRESGLSYPVVLKAEARRAPGGAGAPYLGNLCVVSAAVAALELDY